jgi:hypothetical protein
MTVTIALTFAANSRVSYYSYFSEEIRVEVEVQQQQ